MDMEREIENWFLINCKHHIESFAKRLNKEFFQFTMEVYGASVLREHLENNIDKEALKYLNMSRFLIEWEKRACKLMNIVIVKENDKFRTLDDLSESEKYEKLCELSEQDIWVVSLNDGDIGALKRWEDSV